ncbi:MAG: hypothetical protein ABIO72_05355 [Patescibacteria group bacterium]
MPTRSSRSKPAAASSSAGREMRDAVTTHGSAILALAVFTLLTTFGLALWMLKITVAQAQLQMTLNAVATHVVAATR